MTQNELEYIIAIAEQKNISQAAKKLYIAQPSLWQALAKVEKEFGQPLFDRTSSGLEPTPFGIRYLNTAKEILSCYDQLHTQLDHIHEIQRGKIVLGIPLNLGSYLLPYVLPRFIKAFPAVTLQLKEYNSTELDRLLLSGKTDFNIMHYESSHDFIHYETLAIDPFYLVMPESFREKYQLTENQVITPGFLAQLSNEPFITIADKQKLRGVSDSIFRKARVKPNMKYTTKSMETAKRLVAKECGLTLLPSSYLNLFSDTWGLSCHPLADSLEASWTLVAAYNRQLPLSHCARQFIRILKQSIAEHPIEQGLLS